MQMVRELGGTPRLLLQNVGWESEVKPRILPHNLSEHVHAALGKSDAAWKVVGELARENWTGKLALLKERLQNNPVLNQRQQSEALVWLKEDKQVRDSDLQIECMSRFLRDLSFAASSSLANSLGRVRILPKVVEVCLLYALSGERMKLKDEVLFPSEREELKAWGGPKDAATRTLRWKDLLEDGLMPLIPSSALYPAGSVSSSASGAWASPDAGAVGSAVSADRDSLPSAEDVESVTGDAWASQDAGAVGSAVAAIQDGSSSAVIPQVFFDDFGRTRLPVTGKPKADPDVDNYVVKLPSVLLNALFELLATAVSKDGPPSVFTRLQALGVQLCSWPPVHNCDGSVLEKTLVLYVAARQYLLHDRHKVTQVRIAGGASDKCLFPFAQWVHCADGMDTMLVALRNGPVIVDALPCVQNGKLIAGVTDLPDDAPVSLCAPRNPSFDARSVLQKCNEQSGRLVVLYQAKQANTAETSRGLNAYDEWISKMVSVVKATIVDGSASTHQDTYLIVLVSGHALVEEDLDKLRQSVSRECGSYPIGVLVMSRSDLQQSMPMFSHRFLLGSPRRRSQVTQASAAT
jgi:hypothetical protein